MEAGTTLCIPAWNATGFLAETLEACARQDVPGLRILVSVDGADAATAAACAPFLADPRFAVVVQSQRLGWVGNTNALIAAVRTEHFAIMPHDDLPAPDWLAALHHALAAHPDAVCAYADLEGFGTQEITFAQPEIVGPPLARRLDTLLDHYACVPYRGLFRLRVPEVRPYLPAGLPGDVAADTAWLMELACLGELRRVPRILVRKRYRAGNTHGGWWDLPAEAGVAASVGVIGGMRRRALRGLDGGSAGGHGLIEAAALLRLLGCAAPLPLARNAPVRALLAGHLGTDGLTGLLPATEVLRDHPQAQSLRAVLRSPACRARLAVLCKAMDGGVWGGCLRALRSLAAA